MNHIHLNFCPVCNSKEISSVMSCVDYLTTKEEFTLCNCANCNFTFTQDFPNESSIAKYYDAPEYISHSDTKKGIINQLYHSARNIALKSKINLVNKYTNTTNKSLLDIGCGTGYFLEEAIKQRWNVSGIEKSESVRNGVNKRLGISVNDSDFLPQINSESKDAITMWHVLEHIENLNETMDHLHRILKKDGTVFIALPNKRSADAIHYKAFWAAYDVPRHLWHFSPSDFGQLAKKHNFELVKEKAMYFDPFYISMLSEKYKGTPLSSIVGLIKGGYFYLCSLFNTKKCSSIIYILKKQEIK